MIFKVISGGLNSGKEALLLGLSEGGKLPAWAAAWPAPIRSAAEDLLKTKRVSGKLNETFLLPVAGRWIVFVGVGKAAELTLDKVRQASGTGARRILSAGFDRFTRGLLPVPNASVKQVAQAAAEGTLLGTYSFTQWKSVKPADKKELKIVTVLVGNGKDLSAVRKGIEAGRQVADSALWTRDMVNQPANKLTPTMLANEAKSAARKFRFSCRVLDMKAQKKLGMEALAHQAALHVDAGHDDGVDLALGDKGFQGVEGQKSGHISLINSGFGSPFRARKTRAQVDPPPNSGRLGQQSRALVLSVVLFCQKRIMRCLPAFSGPPPRPGQDALPWRPRPWSWR